MKMNKFIITVLGKDRPGIISSISNVLFEFGCNLENANQMILQEQFAGFFLVDTPPGSDMRALSFRLHQATKKEGLTIHITPVDEKKTSEENIEGETYLITTIGPDQKGLVARFSKILAQFNANIENLKAVFKGGSNPNANFMSYQVFINRDIDKKALFNSLREKADELSLDIRIQNYFLTDQVLPDGDQASASIHI